MIWGRYFDLVMWAIFGVIWLGCIIFLRYKIKKDTIYLVFFTIFSVYLFKVLDYTLFQFQSLLLLKYLVPNLILRGESTREAMNLIPLVTLTSLDLKTSLLNILLFIPFGFGLPFITNVRLKKIVVIGALFSMGIELLQLITGLLANLTFRIADVNDVILNTVGTIIGYLMFVGFLYVFRLAFSHGTKLTSPLIQYIVERPQGEE